MSDPTCAVAADSSVLMALLEGRLSIDAQRALHQHLDACPVCLSLLAALARARTPVASAPGPVAAVGDSAAGEPPLWLSTVLGPSHSRFVPPAEVDEFQILEPLGRGAMGHVYRGYDRLLQRPVAIKFLASRRGAARERFLVEARAIARLTHPNVVAIYRVGECAGWSFLVSELVLGTSLERLPTPLPWTQVLRIAIGLAQGLGAAHRSGVLHRDIKPANAMIDECGGVKLLDFGLAKLLAPLPADAADALCGPSDSAADPGSTALAVAPRAPTLTASGAILGTPLYLAPEVWRASPAGPASDVYSLGALLYELCSCHPPHRGEQGLVALRDAVLGSDATPLHLVAPAVPARFADLIMRCLHRDPRERPASGDALHDALVQVPLARPARITPRALRLAAPGLVAAMGLWGLWASRLPRTDAQHRPQILTSLLSSDPRRAVQATWPPAALTHAQTVMRTQPLAEPLPVERAALSPRTRSGQRRRAGGVPARRAALVTAPRLVSPNPDAGAAIPAAPGAGVRADSAPAVGPPAVAAPLVGSPAVAMPAVAATALGARAVATPTGKSAPTGRTVRTGWETVNYDDLITQ